MEIFELIHSSERYFNRMPICLTKKKKVFKYKENIFIFYLLSDKKINHYIRKCNLQYTDFIVYGKILIDDILMLLLYIDFKYYGISTDGKTRFLGTSIKDLKIRNTKQWKAFN